MDGGPVGRTDRGSNTWDGQRVEHMGRTEGRILMTDRRTYRQTDKGPDTLNGQRAGHMGQSAKEQIAR